MADMRSVIEPKSDQLNTDDLVAGDKTIRITRVHIAPSGEQRVSVFFEGDNGKPWKPCKSMCRVLVEAWGPDAAQYTGRSVRLYKDASVKWGGLAVGGIRISHLSHIERKFITAVTVTKGQRKAIEVDVLPNDPAPPKQQAKQQEPKGAPSRVEQMVEHILSSVAGAADTDSLLMFLGDDKTREQLNYLKTKQQAHFERVDAAIKQRRDQLGDERTPGSDDE